MKKSLKKPKPSKTARTKKAAPKALKTRAKAMAAKPAKKAQTKKPAAAAKAPAKAAPVKAAKAEKIDKKLAAKAAPVAAPTKGKAGKGKEAEVVALVAGKAAPVAKGKGKPAKLAAGGAPKEKSAAAIKAAEAAGEKLCREAGCENIATTKGYCRLDYIKNWKKIKRKEMILKEGKLNQYIEELVSKYPDKYVEVIRQDLSTEVNFTKIIHDLELDESIDDLDYDGDSIDSLIGAISKSSDDIDDGDF